MTTAELGLLTTALVGVAANVTPSARSGSVFDCRPDLLRRVEAIYATDFELYGY